MALNESPHRLGESRNVVFEFSIHFGSGLKEINGTILAVVIGAGSDARDVFRNGGFHRPDERMNGAEDEYGCLFVPARIARHLSAVLGRMRFNGPGGFRPKPGWNSRGTQRGRRSHVP